MPKPKKESERVGFCDKGKLETKLHSTKSEKRLIKKKKTGTLMKKPSSAANNKESENKKYSNKVFKKIMMSQSPIPKINIVSETQRR